MDHETGHSVDGEWRVKEAELYHAYAEAVGALLAHIDDCSDLFVELRDTEAQNSLRSMRGLMRSRYSDLRSLSERLIAEMASG